MDDTVTRADREWLAPAACTLPTVQQPLRLAEFEELFTTAVRSVQRAGPRRLRLALAPQPAVAARAADLVVRETECCSFFTFTLSATAGRVSLEVAVPDEHTDVLDAIAGQAAGTGS